MGAPADSPVPAAQGIAAEMAVTEMPALRAAAAVQQQAVLAVRRSPVMVREAVVVAEISVVVVVKAPQGERRPVLAAAAVPIS